jgi:DNA (cytosine-5)-methyltransferase 1
MPSTTLLKSTRRLATDVASVTPVPADKYVPAVYDEAMTLEATDIYVPSRIPSTHPLHEPQMLTAARREEFRRMAKESRQAKHAAMSGTGPKSLHQIYAPRLDPNSLMPQREQSGLVSLSLFSGGGGLDLGFERAGFTHSASYEWLDFAGDTLEANRPEWNVHKGDSGDVRGVDWTPYRRQIDVLHGGPPCQPFSMAGKQRGALDPRDMWPEFVRAVKTVKPRAFVGENVAALSTSRFADYVDQVIVNPLASEYSIQKVTLFAHEFGVPQLRKRIFFIGFRTKRDAAAWKPPAASHYRPGSEAMVGLRPTMGIREALGLPDIGRDELSPTIRSGLSGPRHTTSIINSVSAQKRFRALEIWGSGVAATREAAQAFVAKHDDYRLSVPEVGIVQGFPEDWKFSGATYMQLGQIGNAVPPALGYAVASSVASVLAK